MRKCKKLAGLLMALSMVVTCLAGVMSMNVKSVHADEKPTVWVVGDSTVSAFNDAYYYPRYGWGTQLDKYIDSTYVIQNLAVSGTSSLSFTANANYATLTGGMKAGDVLLIGFGHNDEKHEQGRYTSPSADYTKQGTFGYSLYENYIKKAQEAGVQVVLCTPIVRRTAGTWSDNDLHITKEETDTAGNKYDRGDYAQVIRDLGTALDIPVVDMTAMTKELYDSLGVDETLNLHAWTSEKPASVDNTHTNIWGGTYNAYLVCKTMKALNVPGIAEHITVGDAPAKADTLVSNPNFVPVDFDGNLKQSELWSDVGIWKGSVLGDVGGVPTKDNFVLEESGQGNIHMAVKNNKGKIAAGSDGIAMYYYKIPVGATFTLSATMTVNSFTANTQVACGLMARDDMYIDEKLSLSSDYVAAGIVDTVSPKNCFYRKSGAVTKGEALTSESLEAGKSYEVKIESNPDGFACTFGTEPTQTAGYDFALTSVDSEYIYVGMFACRAVDVTFSNIKLEVVEPEKTTYNVAFKVILDDVQKDAISVTVTENETVEIPIRNYDGYEFVGVYTEDGAVFDPNTVISQDTSLVLKYTQIEKPDDKPGDNDKPDSSNSGNQGDNQPQGDAPATGSMDLIVYVVLLGVSAMTAMLCMVKRKRA